MSINPLYVLAVAVSGVLDRLWPADVPDCDICAEAERLNDYEAEYETVSPDGYYGYAEPNLRGVSPVSGDTGDSSPAGEAPPNSPAGLPSVDWLSVAVLEVLAEHMWVRSAGDVGACDCDPGRGLDEHEWREHVAPIMAEHVLKCLGGTPHK